MARSRDEGMEERILEAAITVFGERGFQVTTIKDIASGAGISSGSLYTYFSDKDDLFRAAVEFGWTRFISGLEGLSEAGMKRKARISALLDEGFKTLELSLPLLRGMLFDSSRQCLLEPHITRVANAIDALLLPDEIERLHEPGEIVDQGIQHQLIRIMMNGILFTAAFDSSEPVSETLNGLKKSITVFLARSEIARPQNKGTQQ
jgi:AcrR family transcriptional regulator